MIEEVEKISRTVGLRMNAGKCKIMVSNNWEVSTVITAEGTNAESSRRLLLRGQLLIENRKLWPECLIRILERRQVYSKTSKHLEKQEYQPRGEKSGFVSHLSFQPCCMVQNHGHYMSHKWKKLEAAHHMFQRRLLEITWRDKVRNEDISKKTGSRKLEDSL